MDNRKISELIIYLGITPEKQGYNYMELVLNELIDNPNLKLKNAYENISHITGVNSCTMDSSIRNAIHSAYDCGKLMRMNQLMGFEVIDEKICPTNRELIMLIVNHIMFLTVKHDSTLIGA